MNMNAFFKMTLVCGVMLGNSMGVQAASLKFDGANDYVELTRPVSGDFTIELWFRSSQAGGGEAQWYQGRGLVDGEVNGNMNDFGIALGNGKVLFGTGNPDTTIRSPLALNDGSWHHVAATREKATGTLKLYVDGALTATGTASIADLTSPSKMRLGSLATGLNFYQGELDEVRLWNTVRSEAEIAGALNQRVAGNEPGLVAYYPLEESEGAITADATGHGYTGALINGVLWNTVEDAVAPVARTLPAALVTSTSVQLNGWLNTNGLPTTARFQYWTASSTNQTAPMIAAGTNRVLNLDGINDHVRVPAGIWFSN